MPFPTDDLTTNHLDSSTDSAASARVELYNTVLKLKAVMAEFTAGSTAWHSDNDGAGSGLGADTLDGQHGAYYQSSSNQNSGTLPLDRLPATLTGKDADTLDSRHGSFYQNADNLIAGTIPTGRLPVGSTAIKGILELATGAEMTTGTSATLVPPVKEVVDWVTANFQPIVSRSWSNQISSRSSGITYTNSTGADIQVAITIEGSFTSFRGYVKMQINGVDVVSDITTSESNSVFWDTNGKVMWAVIPTGSTYSIVTTLSAVIDWWELR